MQQGREVPVDRVHELFDALTRGAVDVFVAGCCPDLVLTARGSGAMTTLVPRSEITTWYRSMQELAGPSFRSEVGPVLTEDRTHVAVLRHLLTRGSVEYPYETLNHCTLRGDRMASWFAHPLRSSEYARAWGIPVGGQGVPRGHMVRELNLELGEHGPAGRAGPGTDDGGASNRYTRMDPPSRPTGQ
jgi:hypothetical protein